MKITLITVGKTEEDYIREGLEKYTKRLSHYTRFEVKEIPAGKSNLPVDMLKEKEAEGILKAVEGNGSRAVLLDEKGQAFTSAEFSEYLQKAMVSGIKNLYFVIGGAYGFHPTLYKKSPASLALSKMTFTHQMARLVFAEQLYRAFTILKGEKYHH